MLDQGTRQPAGEFAERLFPGMLEACDEERFIAPQRLDERRAGAIGAGRDFPDERCGIERDAAIGPSTSSR
jgi:hypothetical protein